MAEVVQSVPGGFGTGRGKGSKYDKYFDGQIWKLTLGVDFRGLAQHTLNTLHVLARRRRIKVQCAVRDDGRALYVQAIKSAQ